MLFVIYCRDKLGHLEHRMKLRPDHLEYMTGFGQNILLAGPLLEDDGESSLRGLLVVDFPDRAAVERFTENDPYSLGGLFESVSIRRWRQVIPPPCDS